MMKRRIRALIYSVMIVSILTGCHSSSENRLVNVSYDATREFYSSYNELFMEYWKEKEGQDIEIIQSHGGSGKQALEVANGLPADVVTLALDGDVEEVSNAGLIEEGYVKEFDKNSSPYTSTIVFLVRKGNPKEIHDWDDLLRDGVEVITPNPKTSGGARWNYLAAWYYFESKGLSENEIKESISRLYKNVLVLDSGARGSSTTFVENGQGDVLIAWENEAFLSLQERPDDFEIVIPSVSILCQPTVAVVDENATKHGTNELSEEYLKFLYTENAQVLAAQNYFRPVDEEVKKRFEVPTDERTISKLSGDGKWIVSDINLTDIYHFGGWDEVNSKHFSSGGIFDEIYK